MLVEIPDPEVILGIVLAFIGGFFILNLINKIKTRPHSSNENQEYINRLEFYERQLIDMKIRLDSMEILNLQGENFQNSDNSRYEPISRTKENTTENLPKPQIKKESSQNVEVSNLVDYVLGLITHKSMTSRDIQKESHRSREHISRLLNKLYKEGYVERSTKTKPYTYSISSKGKEKLSASGILHQALAQ